MKRLVIACSLTVATAFLLVHCKNAKNTAKNNNTAQSGNTRMTRIKGNFGLEYEILQEGSGASPKTKDFVTVHYTGWLNENGQQGKKFDSSYDRNQAFTFQIGVHEVIQGWDEGVMGMKIGEKRRLYIPAALGYGAHSAGAVIKPNSDLIFDVELVKIN
jgi:FKBP-type peptidyl-prolyl cis-trans isomerase